MLLLQLSHLQFPKTWRKIIEKKKKVDNKELQYIASLKLVESALQVCPDNVPEKIKEQYEIELERLKKKILMKNKYIIYIMDNYYKNKYFKYKDKYLNLKGGSEQNLIEYRKLKKIINASPREKINIRKIINIKQIKLTIRSNTNCLL